MKTNLIIEPNQQSYHYAFLKPCNRPREAKSLNTIRRYAQHETSDKLHEINQVKMHRFMTRVNKRMLIESAFIKHNFMSKTEWNYSN
ncbi:hypothetical protein Hanom_Chr16g01421491 [Helianthus anomalus]